MSAHQEIRDAIPNANAGISQQQFCWVSISLVGWRQEECDTLESWNHVMLEPWNLGTLRPRYKFQSKNMDAAKSCKIRIQLAEEKRQVSRFALPQLQ